MGSRTLKESIYLLLWLDLFRLLCLLGIFLLWDGSQLVFLEYVREGNHVETLLLPVAWCLGSLIAALVDDGWHVDGVGRYQLYLGGTEGFDEGFAVTEHVD